MMKANYVDFSSFNPVTGVALWREYYNKSTALSFTESETQAITRLSD